MKKKLLLILLSGWAGTSAAQYASQGLSLLGRWDDTTIAPNSSWVHSRYSSCIGWVDSLGNEYGIIGSQLGTHIIDLANPANPVQADFVPGRRVDCLWREYKTYSHYLYMVSDDAVPNSFQIADLAYLPDSVHVIYDSDSLFARAHTVFVDGDKLYAGSVTTLTGTYTMGVFSLADPEHPQLLRNLRQDVPWISLVHDMYVRNDTVYASCGLQGMYLLKLEPNNTFSRLDSFRTSPSNYNHSSFLSDDGQTLFFTEEVPAGRPVITLDVSNPLSVAMLNSFYSHTGATPHNPYIRDNLLYVAYYQDGLQVYDVSDPQNVTPVGYFDTFPFDTTGYLSPDYQGAWGAYPFLPSGHVLVSDMQSGLFVLDADSITGLHPLPAPGAACALSVRYGPGRVRLQLNGFTAGQTVSLAVFDLSGRQVASQETRPSSARHETELTMQPLPSGLYLLRAVNADGSEHAQVKIYWNKN
jgi:choice-of-anchor B domain-containing protein